MVLRSDLVGVRLTTSCHVTFDVVSAPCMAAEMTTRISFCIYPVQLIADYVYYFYIITLLLICISILFCNLDAWH